MKPTSPKVIFVDPFHLTVFWSIGWWIFTNFLEFQDPAKPKPKKRNERSKDKVAQSEKALAKARAEKEAAKKAASIEVNSPWVGSKAEDVDLSFHSSNFRARGILEYTP